MQEQAEKNLEEVEGDYPGLHLVSCKDGIAVYCGRLVFTASYEGHGLVDDAFDVELELPIGGFGVVPVAREIGGRIPREPAYHINDDGTMCLGAPLEVRRKFMRDRSLRGLINLQVVPFLYGYCIKQDKDYWPFGELAHGSQGIVQYYQKIFGVKSVLSIIEFLKILVEDNYRGHLPCPCGSERRLRNCHGQQIMEMKDIQSRENYFSDFVACVRQHVNSGEGIPRRVMTKRLRVFWMRMGQEKTLFYRFFKK